jgi:hypothetical protein
MGGQFTAQDGLLEIASQMFLFPVAPKARQEVDSPVSGKESVWPSLVF